MRSPSTLTALPDSSSNPIGDSAEDHIGLSQREAASRMAVDLTTLARWEVQNEKSDQASGSLFEGTFFIFYGAERGT